MDTVVELDVQLLSFLAGTVVPLLVAIGTKLHSSSRVKAVMNVVLSVAVGALAYLLEHNGKFTFYELAGAIVTAYLASGVTYKTFWEPTGATPALRERTREAGVGAPSRDTLPDDLR